MAKAKRKSTTKPKAPRVAPKPSTLARIVDAQVKRDPIFKAIEAYDKARGRVLLANGSEKDWDAILDAATKAEYRCAETVPASLRGIMASARWFVRFVADHDGIGNLDGHHAVETWPVTIRDALKNLWMGVDPVNEAIQLCGFAHKRFAEIDEKADKAAHDVAEREWSAAETRMMQTAPTTPFGIANALDALLANRATYEMEDDVAGWLRLLSDAARALA